MNTMKRRTFLKGALASGIVVAAAGAGLLHPTEVLAAAYPKKAFGDTDVNKTLTALFGSSKHSPSDKIIIDAPVQAENATVVPITVSTSLKADTIAVLALKNPGVLTSSIDLPGAIGFYSVRIKMGESSDVLVVVKSGDKLYSAKRLVKVTVGGCGG